MRTILLLLVLAVPASGAAAKSDEEAILYTLGFLIGRNLASFSLASGELPAVQAGLKDAALGEKPRHELAEYAPKIEEWNQKRSAKQAEGEKTRSKPFLDKAAKEKGAQRLPSGLILIPIKKGTGPSPKAADSVKAHYEGKLIDGTKFDSSYDRGEPTDFPLNGVIPCWTEGLQKMKAGGKARLICPSDIAYGDEGRPPTIPPGAVLDFTVELIGINK